MVGRMERERSVYLSLRIKTLREEVKALKEERKAGRTALREMTNRRTAEAKALKHRAIYVDGRLEEAQVQIGKVIEDKKAIDAAIKNASTTETNVVEVD